MNSSNGHVINTVVIFTFIIWFKLTIRMSTVSAKFHVLIRTSTLYYYIIFVDNGILYVANNRVADEFRSMSEPCLCVRPPSSGHTMEQKLFNGGAAPNTRPAPLLFWVMFDFYGYFQWIIIRKWSCELYTINRFWIFR